MLMKQISGYAPSRMHNYINCKSSPVLPRAPAVNVLFRYLPHLAITHIMIREEGERKKERRFINFEHLTVVGPKVAELRSLLSGQRDLARMSVQLVMPVISRGTVIHSARWHKIYQKYSKISSTTKLKPDRLGNSGFEPMPYCAQEL